ncbi:MULTISPECIES: hypothetical protein [Actinoplanes]|uniref:hypothetical protein n=1 Tax=Actinoplanes TaxID=1865 RepID=UPI0005F2A1EB|nr:MULTISPECIES: hypothetical protein [Actinoplanes]GLY00195.1 hypothetical protein Acsp01_05740 [Actinoplanes sp. NBRC 101535]
MAAAIADDPSAPVFAVSYGRPAHPQPVAAPREPATHVMRFFDDLTANVSELIGSPVGQHPGFLDIHHGGGELWEPTVLRAVGTCQVLISLLSQRYLFQSAWCAREFDLFTRRRVVPRAGSGPVMESAVVPVLWTPFRDQLPPLIAKVNVFSPTGLPDPDYGERYRTDGLFGLIETRQSDVYKMIVWRLALHIQRLHSLYWVEPAVPGGVEGLRTSFAEEATS